MESGEEFEEEDEEDEPDDTGMIETEGRCCCSTTSNLTDLVLRLEEDSE